VTTPITASGKTSGAASGVPVTKGGSSGPGAGTGGGADFFRKLNMGNGV
jgi:hypothetical protein